MTLRNIGLKEATGEWVINTNDDNYYVPVYLEELNKVIESNQECNFIYYDCVLNHHNIILPWYIVPTVGNPTESSSIFIFIHS